MTLQKHNWLADKLRKRAVTNKNRPGRKQEHAEALLEDQLRTAEQTADGTE